MYFNSQHAVKVYVLTGIRQVSYEGAVNKVLQVFQKSIVNHLNHKLSFRIQSEMCKSAIFIFLAACLWISWILMLLVINLVSSLLLSSGETVTH